jgi:hypothetical protein
MRTKPNIPITPCYLLYRINIMLHHQTDVIQGISTAQAPPPQTEIFRVELVTIAVNKAYLKGILRIQTPLSS